MSFAVSKGMILEFPNVSDRHKEDLKSKKEAVVKAMRQKRSCSRNKITLHKETKTAPG